MTWQQRKARIAYRYLESLSDADFDKMVQSMKQHRAMMAAYMPAMVKQFNQSAELMKKFKGRKSIPCTSRSMRLP